MDDNRPKYICSKIYSISVYQRFDFIVRPQKEDHYSLVVEAKALNESNLKKHEEQIVKYMKDNQEYPWGILTNGFEWC